MLDQAKSADSAAAGYDIEDMHVGMTATMTHTVTIEDIVAFAAVSGDDNPVHLDEEYASKTMFGGRIAHGMLSAGYISAVIGTRLPGYGCVYLGQNLKFKAPVKIGDTVETTATVTALDPEKRRVTLDTVCSVGGTVVIDGEANVLIPKAN